MLLQHFASEEGREAVSLLIKDVRASQLEGTITFWCIWVDLDLSSHLYQDGLYFVHSAHIADCNVG